MFFFLTTTIILALDLWTKSLAQNINWPIWGCISLHYQTNNGVAFSLPLYGWGQLLLTGLLIIGGLFWLYHYLDWKKPTGTIISGLILGGALGNFYERLRFSTVTDFVHVCGFPTFNLADAAICVGTILLLIFYQHLIRPTRSPSVPPKSID